MSCPSPINRERGRIPGSILKASGCRQSDALHAAPAHRSASRPYREHIRSASPLRRSSKGQFRPSFPRREPRGPIRTSAGLGWHRSRWKSRQCGCGAGRETASAWNVSGERLFMSSAAALPLVVLSTPQVFDARGHKLANNTCYYQASGQNLESGTGSPNAGKEESAAPR
jgi:hypothetical protein